jgi:hypothetical protein
MALVNETGRGFLSGWQKLDGGNEEKRPLPALIPMEDQGLGGRFHHQLKLIRISL